MGSRVTNKEFQSVPKPSDGGLWKTWSGLARKVGERATGVPSMDHEFSAFKWRRKNNK